MIVLGAIIAVGGCWIVSQSMAANRLGPSLVAIGMTLVLVGLWK